MKRQLTFQKYKSELLVNELINYQQRLFLVNQTISNYYSLKNEEENSPETQKPGFLKIMKLEQVLDVMPTDKKQNDDQLSSFLKQIDELEHKFLVENVETETNNIMTTTPAKDTVS